MPIHVALDANQVCGTLELQNVKVAQADFADSAGNPVTFSKEPMIQMTLLNVSTVPPYKIVSIKTGNVFTGFKVGFSALQTLSIDWSATQRL